jgi:flagellar biosynthetic protein FliO
MEPLWPTLLALAAVCALALVVLRGLSRRGVGQGTRTLRVIERLALEPRRSIYLVEAGGRHLLVGVGEGAMSVLAELDPATAAAAGTAASGPRDLGGIWAQAWRALATRASTSRRDPA